MPEALQGGGVAASLTLGQARVRKTFNPSSSSDVETIKDCAAALIDFLEHQKDRGADHRLVALAQTAIEEGAMWGVKAVTG